VQVQSATGAAREAALEAAHRAEEALHITKARAAEAAGATKDKAQRTAQQAVEQAEAAAAAARDKVQHATRLLHALKLLKHRCLSSVMCKKGQVVCAHCIIVTCTVRCGENACVKGHCRGFA
jgi:hypothetical protein